jgi:Xaa-Pro aminopeptidase
MRLMFRYTRGRSASLWFGPPRCMMRRSYMTSEPGGQLASAYRGLMPGISAEEYQARRTQLAHRLPPGSLALFPARPRGYMSHDVPFPHHQDTDLSYLCGFLEPSSLLAVVKPASGGSARWRLFVKPSCPDEAMWDGPRAGVEGAQRHFLPDGDAHALHDAPKVLHADLHSAADNVAELLYAPKYNPEIDALLRPMLDAAAKQRVTQPPDRYTQPLRLRKSAAEQALMRRSAAVCTSAMRDTMQMSRSAASRGMSEGVLAASFEFGIKLGGAERLAYPCVVACGANAVTLHYMHNDAPLRPESMLLMDAGASLHGYCSDLTRTWPLNGRYSAEQRALYDAVLDVNERIIARAFADGQTTLNSLHRLSIQYTYENLIALGILRAGDRHGLRRCQRYYPHAIGHWLGLDVHDTPAITSSTPLEAGMVITVEPGLYFPTNDPELPDWCKGIGIRIEDDVLVRADGAPPEVLTASAPKRAADVEALMAAA